MKKVSIKDIAKKAGVSHTTVSIVINGKGAERKISVAMIDKIMKVAQKLNYRPNQFAKSFRTGKTFTIGLIVDDISNFFFGHLAKAVEEEAGKFGYTVMFCNSENDEGKARNVLGSLVEKRMDGYIIAPTVSMAPEINHLKTEGKPIVLIDRFVPNIEAAYVTIDNFKGAYDSVSHLVENGYNKIAIVTNETEQIQLVQRLEGYISALRKHKLRYSPARVKKIPFHYSEKKKIKEIENFLKEQTDIDAILFTSNNLGIPGVESLKNLNEKIAEDIAVICFDDNDLFRLSSPAITVVAQPIRQMGRHAVKMLMDQIELNGSYQEESFVLPPNLIVRDSTPVKEKRIH